MRRYVFETAAALVSAAILATAGCGSTPTVTDSPHLVDPEAVSPESGSTDDIYAAVQQAINSLMLSPRVAKRQGGRVILDQIVNKTGIPNYDENIIYNKFLNHLVNNSGDKLIFLDRNSVSKERALQLSGQVKTTGIESAPAGADMVLDIELRQLPGRATQTIQYNFRITELSGEILWTFPWEIKKRS